MSQRRMLAKSIISSDLFLEMPLSTQALYMHLVIAADDDGFVNNPKTIKKYIGASDDDLRILLAKKFIIKFQTGVIVITHWKVNNYIRIDRYKASEYRLEKEQLKLENNVYVLDENKENLLDF